MPISGGELVAKSLSEHGVKVAYGLHGGHLQMIFNALPDYGIDLYTTRDERAAAYMAHAHTQLTGRTGVALATAGPGVTNAFTGIANAAATQLPILLIGGAASTKQLDRKALQEMDQESIFEPVTKWAGTVFEPERVPEYVDLALRHASSPRPGPSFLNVPLDVQNKTIPESAYDEGIARTYTKDQWNQSPRPPRDAVDRCVKALEDARRPVLVTGIGVLRANCGDLVRQFIERAAVPYLGTAESRGFVPGDHSLNVNAARSKALNEADTVVLLGKSLDFGLAFGSETLINGDAKIVQIDADSTEIGLNRPADVAVVGNEREVLKHLLNRVNDATPPREDAWIDSLQRKDQTSRSSLDDKMYVDDDEVHPWRLCAEVRDRLDDDAIIGCDGGDILSFGRIALDVSEPGHWFSPGPFGCLGATVAFSVAASILRPSHQAVCLIGDGSFGFSAMEVDTAARYDCDVTFVVSNNAAWNIDRYDQQEEYERVVGTELQYTRYDRMAEAVDGKGEHVETTEELGPALDRAFEYDGPSVVNVVVQRDVESPDYQQGMRSHGDAGMPDFQLLKPWDEVEREKREKLDMDW